jgi:hypothetical protein
MAWHVTKEPHPDAQPAKCGIVGFRIRDDEGTVIAEAFPRPYKVAVSEENFHVLAAAPGLLAFAESTAQRLADLPRYLDNNDEHALGSIVCDVLAAADEIAARARGGWPWPLTMQLGQADKAPPPDAGLLAALKNLLAEAQSRFDGIDTTDEEDAAIEAAEAAIAAAEGHAHA